MRWVVKPSLFLKGARTKIRPASCLLDLCDPDASVWSKDQDRIHSDLGRLRGIGLAQQVSGSQSPILNLPTRWEKRGVNVSPGKSELPEIRDSEAEEKGKFLQTQTVPQTHCQIYTYQINIYTYTLTHTCTHMGYCPGHGCFSLPSLYYVITSLLLGHVPKPLKITCLMCRLNLKY